jgi:two-component system, chemotaxis family, sensor kinase CheA
VFGSGADARNSELNGLDGRSRAADDKLPLVVVSIGSEHQVGLVVDRILDIVEQAIDIKGAATQAGISYCAVIQGQVTEILDVDAIINNNLFGIEQMLASAR